MTSVFLRAWLISLFLQVQLYCTFLLRGLLYPAIPGLFAASVQCSPNRGWTRAERPQSGRLKLACANTRMYLGRSLNSCQAAFSQMYHQHIQPPLAPRPSISQPQPVRRESVTPAAPVGTSNLRKRPLCPSTDKPPPLAPRAIQPRPASHSRGDSSSTIVSPSGDEPPRKRGRPSKIETERRRVAAEAKGEPYPPPRRTGSGRSKVPSTPSSPPGTITAMGGSYSPQAGGMQGPGPERYKPETRYVPPSGTGLEHTGFGGDEQRSKDAHDRDSRPASNRDLPRPMELRQPLPSPQELQLGHPETIPRISAAEPSLPPFPPSRISRAFDGARHALGDPVGSRRPEQPPVSAPTTTLGTSGDKLPGRSPG